MEELVFTVTTKSPVHLGSGKEGVVLDAAMVEDECGLPYFPGRRLKGLLYESALEMAEISRERWFTIDEVNAVFGHSGLSALFVIDNLYVEDYERQHREWTYLKGKFPAFFTAQSISRSYSDVRYQTAIDQETGTAQEGSLRNIQVLDSGTEFTGRLIIEDQADLVMRVLEKAVPNLRYVGAKRSRGLGHVRCTLSPRKGK